MCIHLADLSCIYLCRKQIPVLNDPRISIKSVQDFKAAKKFISAIQDNKHRDQIIITVDDDYFYTPRLIETLVENYHTLNNDDENKAAVSIMGYRINQDKTWGADLKAPNWFSFSEFSYYFVRGFRIRKPYRVSVTTGSGGVCFNAKWFKKVNISNFDGAPTNSPLLDDIWLNGILSGIGVKRFVVPINDVSTSIVRESIIDSSLDKIISSDVLNHNAKRYQSNNEMIAYFDDAFTRENVWYVLGGETHPEYISYFYIGIVEPVKLFFKSMWVSLKYPRSFL